MWCLRGPQSPVIGLAGILLPFVPALLKERLFSLESFFLFLFY
nr:MAG TPA: hypothetical protein [Caudoviricetes sp.]